MRGRLFCCGKRNFLINSRICTNRVIIVPERCDRSQKVHGMIPNSILGYHAPPVCYICVVSEREDACVGNFERQQRLRPWRRCALGRPRLLTVSRQAVDEDDAGQRVSSRSAWNVRS